MGRIRRRTYLVDKKLHYRLLGYNAVYFFIAVLALGPALFTPSVFEISDPSLFPRQQAEVADKAFSLHAPTCGRLF